MVWKEENLKDMEEEAVRSIFSEHHQKIIKNPAQKDAKKSGAKLWS